MRDTSVRICTRSLASRFESGSSMRKTAGSRTIARPMATRWRWPPESCDGLAVEVLLEVEDARRLGHLLVDLGSVGTAQLEREAHVVAHAHVRIERVVLEHHRDVAVLGRLVVHHVVADPQLALGDVLEPGDHAQGGGLAAAGGADEDHELAVLDLQAHVATAS